jgi:hypothetical protein
MNDDDCSTNIEEEILEGVTRRRGKKDEVYTSLTAILNFGTLYYGKGQNGSHS